MNDAYSAPTESGRWQQRALIVGVVFSLLFIVGALLDRNQFFHSYLVAYLFWTGIALGSLAILLLQHLTGGAWGLVIRRVLEAATRTFLNGGSVIPIILGAPNLSLTHHGRCLRRQLLSRRRAFI